MKTLYFIILCLLCHPSFAQRYIIFHGKVKARSTDEPIPYASVYLDGTSIGTTTNKLGEFAISLSSKIQAQHLVISHLGYQPQKIEIEKAINVYQNISLTTESLHLKEVVVKPLNAVEIVYSALDRIPENYYTSPYTIQGFQREYVTHEDNFIQLLEVAFQTKGTTVLQSSKVLKARYIENKREKESLWDPSRGGFYTFGWTSISGIEQPAQTTFLGVELKKKSDLLNYYEFELKESVSRANQEVYVIAFDQKKKVRKPLLNGKIYIDASSRAIVKLTFGLSPRGVKFLKSHKTWAGKRLSKPPKKIDVKQDLVKINYKKYGEKWFMNSMIMDTEFDASLVLFGVVLSQKRGLKFHSERTITAIDTTNLEITSDATSISDIGRIPTLQNFIKKNYENYDEHSDEKWTYFNVIKSDTSFAQIAAQLRMSNQAWKNDKVRKATSAHYSPKQVREDLDYLAESLETIHPGLYWYMNKTHFDDQVADIKKKLAKKTNETELFQLLSPLIAQINCGHTQIYPSVPMSKYHGFHNIFFPLKLWIAGDSAFVIKDYHEISKGSKLVSINHIPISVIIHQLKACIPTDGYNQTYKEFHLQKEFSRLYAQYYGVIDTFNIEFKGPYDQNQTIRLSGAELTSAPENKVATLNTYNPLSLGVLTIPSFSTSQDFPSFLKDAFQRIKDQEVSSLIIDLRNNTGGKDEYADLLYAYLAYKPYKIYQSIKVASIDTVFLNRLSFGNLRFNQALPNYAASTTIKDGHYLYIKHQNMGVRTARSDAFKGRVYILINGGTFSAAADFAAIARSNKRATFIGQEAGGGYYGNCSFGNPFLTLPNSKIRVTIPLGRYELAVRQDVPAGHGVIPDYYVSYGLGDILHGRDKEMELCHQIIKENIK
ncbi:hypothetical protein FNH22_28580 [Fulvivirga sp. M361]|uniref:S41 family peptidase n=1 Tax=Fulvivirga sp. M361 TaxID=2594266 RepID=UPI0011798B17|nr:S41 family peptidase [Fulvivirga sp. M361]TRX48721.1 hypothetical protein FNH22_28580 [Fulvivirga sp. M361]